MPYPKRPLEERFWRNVEPDTNGGCLLWSGSLNSHGYGQIVKDGTRAGTLAAHRVSWEIHNGPIPDHPSYHGLCVRHKCDVPACVNPAHLFLSVR